MARSDGLRVQRGRCPIMTDPRQPIFEAVGSVDPTVFEHSVDEPLRIGALESVLDALGIPRAPELSKLEILPNPA